MTTTAGIGFGATFTRSSTGASGGTMSSIGEIISITPPSIKRDTIDATHMGSTGGFREYISGLRDGGEASAEIQYDPNGTAASAMVTDVEADTVGYYEITFPDGTVAGFSAFATGFEATTPMDDKMVATFTFKITGKPTWV